MEQPPEDSVEAGTPPVTPVVEPAVEPAADIGKYDSLCEQVLRMTEARTVILMILEGHKGSGFSVCTLLPREDLPTVPKILREIAGQIETQAALEVVPSDSEKSDPLT